MLTPATPFLEIKSRAERPAVDFSCVEDSPISKSGRLVKRGPTVTLGGEKSWVA